MAQIAQQDNLLIVSSTKASTLDAESKKKLLSCIKSGIITDVILQTKESANLTNWSKIVAYSKDATNAEDVKYKVMVLVGSVPTEVALN